MIHARGRLAVVIALVASLGCAEVPPATVLSPAVRPGYEGYASRKYAEDKEWLCKPDLASDACRSDLAATEVHSDGTRSPAPFVRASDPKVDCFYVYPTVDLSPRPANHTDFSNLAPMGTTALAQVGRFGEVCRMFAPLYRQATIGSYFFGASARDARLAVGYSDVADAFAHYLGQYNHGRKVVVVGHSQGAEMVIRLLRQFFEQDATLRDRLLLAMAIGGDVEVPPGKLAGGTLPTIPLCSRDDETGCVIAFRTHHGSGLSGGPSAPRPGLHTGCVNPTNIEHNERRPFSLTYLPTGGRARSQLVGIEGIQTPFVVFPSLYSGQCVDGADGYRYLAVDEIHAPGDVRKSPFELDQFALRTSLGTHILDFQFPQGDLVAQIARRVAALPAPVAAPAP